MTRTITVTVNVTDESWCHCGSPMRDSDHCPVCGCEEFESVCDHKASDQEIGEAIGVA